MGNEAHELDLTKYARAIEKALPEIPVENGAVRLEAIWLETALPEDIIVEILREHELELPANVERIVAEDGQVLRERRWDRNGRGSAVGEVDPPTP